MLDTTPLVTALQSKLNPLFRPGRVWEYADLCLLMDIARRPEPLVECDIIVEYHAKMVASGRKQYFPQSAYNVLSRWGELLDKAWGFTSESEPVSKSVQMINANIELKRLEPEMKRLKNLYHDGDRWTDTVKLETFRALAGRKKELLAVLGMKV